ncbi:MAG TPA: hypothetical protein VHL59_11385 [Thermoanaerobaculia bacterium]|nr:hypothetical protein [Thermoanaerobaculia bacterium]
MNEHQLRIIFDGIVVSGPAYPSSGTRRGPFFAVMPFTTRHRSRLAKDDRNDWYIPVHVPVIAARDTLVSKGRKPDEIYRRCPSNVPAEPVPTFHLWYPLRERIGFSFDGDADPRELTYRFDDPDPATEQHREWPGSDHLIHSVHKVPRMSDIFPYRNRLRRAALAKGPRTIRGVLAQAFVPFGEVSGGSDRDSISAGGVDAEFQPTRVDPPHCKKIVPQVVVTVPVRKYVKLSMSSLDTGEELEPIELEITQDEMIRIDHGDPANTRYVLSRLLNPAPRPLDEVRNKPQLDGATVDIDFEALYEPLRGDDGKAMPVPNYRGVPVGMRDCFGVMADEEPAGGCLSLFGLRRRS